MSAPTEVACIYIVQTLYLHVTPLCKRCPRPHVSWEKNVMEQATENIMSTLIF